MFDSIRVTTASAYPQTIHEHRAPTDKSIELAEDYREKILKNVMSCIPTEFNDLQGTMIRYRDNQFFEEFIGIRFNLNGAEHIWKYKMKFWNTGIEEIIEDLRKDFSEYLAMAILRNMDLRPLFNQPK